MLGISFGLVGYLLMEIGNKQFRKSLQSKDNK